MSKMNITGRYMNEKIKQGWSAEDFAKHFGTTKEEFILALEKKFSSKASSQMMKRMEKNAKRKENLISAPVVEAEETFESTDEEFTSAITDLEDDSPESQIDILKRRESKLSSRIFSLESQHSELVSKRAAQRAEFKQQKMRLSALVEKLERAKSEFKTTFSEWKHTGAEMKELSSSIRREKQVLQSVRKEISSLQKVFIFAYCSGELEIENNSDIDLTVEPADVAVKFGELIDLSAVDSLAIKEVRQLARLLLLMKKIQANKVQFELTFENEKLEAAYNDIS